MGRMAAVKDNSALINLINLISPKEYYTF